MAKVSTCPCFGKDVERAVERYVPLVPDSRVDHVQRAPGAWPGGEAGDVILLAFTLGGQSFQALNGGAPADYGAAASISVSCADQAEVDRLWAALTADAGRRSPAAGCATAGASPDKSSPRSCRAFSPTRTRASPPGPSPP